MKPTQVADCDHYNWDTNKCSKCDRMMPEICVEFEELQRKAKAYDEKEKQNAKKPEASPPSRTDGAVGSTDDGPDDTVAAVATPAVPKPRGRAKRVAQ